MKTRLSGMLHGMAQGKKLCYEDFHLHNLIYDGKDITIINWWDTTAGDALADACRTYLVYTYAAANLAGPYLQLYCQRAGISTSDVLKWMPVMAAARLRENLSQAERDYLTAVVHESADSP